MLLTSQIRSASKSCTFSCTGAHSTNSSPCDWGLYLPTDYLPCAYCQESHMRFMATRQQLAAKCQDVLTDLNYPEQSFPLQMALEGNRRPHATATAHLCF